jgi:predicted alpha/beta hydrolase family esterase
MKRATIFFVQGGGKNAYSADKKLVSYLEKALGEKYEIIYPNMPGEDDPNYEAYKATIEKELKRIDSDLMLVGHSLGACFLLKYLTETNIEKNIVGIFLAATPFWGEGGWQFEGFSLDNELAATITAGIPIFFYHSTDDEIVPFTHFSLYKEKFPHAKFREIAKRGHQLENDLSEMVDDITTLR